MTFNYRTPTAADEIWINDYTATCYRFCLKPTDYLLVVMYVTTRNLSWCVGVHMCAGAQILLDAEYLDEFNDLLQDLGIEVFTNTLARPKEEVKSDA